MNKDLIGKLLPLALIAIGLVQTPGYSQASKTLQGGVEEKGVSNQGGDAYPTMQMVAPAYAPPPQKHPPKKFNGGTQQNRPLQGGAQQAQQAPARPPLQMTVTKTLPPSLLGTWAVQGNRTQVEAMNPQFQQQASNAFAMNTNNTWTISGDPQHGYNIGSDTGVQFQLWVDKVEGGAAFVRYQHPINNTMAQEAIVMQLDNGGVMFTGLERVTIVKQGEGPRCKVTYQLVGHRR